MELGLNIAARNLKLSPYMMRVNKGNLENFQSAAADCVNFIM
jgi:hypothetical protein